ncbi:enoyl-CoA hydratase/isomerase family protein [Bordetella genomosp. 9]|nr:enoyl-CoA hydratase/isomerase family protein [Bordetella genomosp. 9]
METRPAASPDGASAGVPADPDGMANPASPAATAPNADPIIVERHPGWAVVRIARTARRNALDRRARIALLRAFDSLQGQARCIVLTGTDGSFCAGLDLKERAGELAAGQRDTSGDEWIAVNMAIRRHPAVFIAAVNGMALGGGMTLVNSCDLALAAEDAWLGCPELASSAYAGAAGPTGMLSWPRKRVAWMLLTAERIDAHTAERWGVVNEVVAADGLLARARELATRIAGFDVAALEETKKSLDHVPAQVADWEGAMRYGQSVNAAIRARRANE